jgi:hypothetical protein
VHQQAVKSLCILLQNQQILKLPKVGAMIKSFV